ncbi:2'-5' RNA ligase family protein [Actinoplanes sp. NBRC 101535]|uniref:2'-5' RNA ligase family protein n=1 Tax=Actinoplanes sp. NBRC 101535 TaxID=3032196 RepID=UPI0024A25FF7|nr:2'-5' RNA ligase family protein [Actinoplanes sp. NBRC 101535]GLY08126.1 hypothetical protein Acsp01_85050 [Actinoplanes sp. NBRC 101535]
MHTVELLLDDALDHAVRVLWSRLHDAGLPSLATHRHLTNRPHVTLTSTPAPPTPPPLALPAPVVLGPPVSLGRALVLSVSGLEDLQHLVWSALGAVSPWHTPDAWTPHVSLALNLPADRHSEARTLLSGLSPLSGLAVAARSYDTASRTVTAL